MTVCTSFLEQICRTIHPPLWESGFAGVGHFVRQLKKKERIFRSKLERRGPSLPLNLVERLSALLNSGILAELQLLSFLTPAKFKTKQAHQKPTQKKQSLKKVWLLWIKAYEHDTKIIVFWIGAMSVTSMLSGLFLGQCLFWEGYSWPLIMVLHSNDDSIPWNPLFLKEKENSSWFTCLYISCFLNNDSEPILRIKKKVILPNFK